MMPQDRYYILDAVDGKRNRDRSKLKWRDLMKEDMARSEIYGPQNMYLGPNNIHIKQTTLK